MCGIAGALSLDDRDRDLAALAGRMAATLSHRGPDDSGVWQAADGSVALSHRRLSIIDLSPLGRNPMATPDGEIWITFNGEIYNFLELRRELELDGYRFRSHTDTEVILAAYERWGLEAVQRLAGMFAFALWDGPRRRLWLVRDRLGKKPLYYSHRGGTLVFASELKALVVDDSFATDVDGDGLRLYLRYGYVPSPLTIYRQARKLPPAHHLVCEHGQIKVERYWDPLASLGSLDGLTDTEAEAQLEDRLTLAVRQRRIADVPLGAFLSGGIDSSLVVALMQEQTSTPVQTFTIRFENPEYNEADHAASVARHLGTDHHEQTCGAAQMLDIVESLPTMFDEPFADSSAIPTHLVSRIARQRVTVALSGDGGDELFFGYPRYQHFAKRGWALDLPLPLRRIAGQVCAGVPVRRWRRIGDVLRSSDPDRYARFVSWFTPDEVAALTGAPAAVAPLYADAFNRLGDASRAETAPMLDVVSYLPEDILTKVDRASMAVGLETRAPILDHRVVEFAVALPLRLKYREQQSKWLLRRLLDKRVPRALIDRPKMGFGVPLVDWFRGPLREQMSDYCGATDLEDLGVDPMPIRRLWSSFSQGDSYRAELLWLIFALVAWSRRWRSAAARSAVA